MILDETKTVLKSDGLSSAYDPARCVVESQQDI